ncbi:subtilisin-like protein [Lactarius deliciosus]|nr:subtilisin-like protein [Lactarius deliciosus]
MHNHCISVLSVIVLVLLGGLAKPLSPPWDDMHIKHSWNAISTAIPKSWEALGGPPSGTTIDLYIALRPQHENAVVDCALRVPPLRCRYRAYLTKEQVADLVAPRPETLELVNTWLDHHGISSSANTLLGASYQLYRHVKSNETIIRTVGYALPAALHWHVLTVMPTTSFISPRTQWQKPRNRSDRAVDYVTPSFLHWLYDTEAYIPGATDRNVLGVVGFLGDYPSPTDLTLFMQKYRSDADDATYTVVRVNGGGYDPTHPHEEANGRRMTISSSFLEYTLDQEDIPQTISISYDRLEENVNSREYMVHVCDLFSRLSVRGVSVLLPSGNWGVGEDCVMEDGSIRLRANFPASCTSLCHRTVTVVGGTTEYGPEVAASLSGGGFSDHFRRPPYQQEAVSTFLRNLGNQYQGLYNTSGRGIPDIAAQASDIKYFSSGNERAGSGTSAATPIVAGIISLLNDWLVLRGQPPLGFLKLAVWRRLRSSQRHHRGLESGLRDGWIHHRR